MFDPELYRDKREVAEWMKRCPVATYTGTLRDRGIVDDTTMASLELEIATEIEDAVAFAEAGQWEPVESLTKWVYSAEPSR
jgi:TPP-dependent pyruvate/acetoin dehydrogenase alpha subunit